MTLSENSARVYRFYTSFFHCTSEQPATFCEELYYRLL